MDGLAIDARNFLQNLCSCFYWLHVHLSRWSPVFCWVQLPTVVCTGIAKESIFEYFITAT